MTVESIGREYLLVRGIESAEQLEEALNTHTDLDEDDIEDMLSLYENGEYHEVMHILATYEYFIKGETFMSQKTQKPTLSWWKWGNDKFATGYKIFTIFWSKWFDIYLFRYESGSHIPKHKDPGKFHYRINWVIKKPKSGGEFICNNYNCWIKDRLFGFRADKNYHKVTKTEGERWVLSIGFKR